MSTFLLGLRYFFIDLLGGVLRFPIWWYSHGLFIIARGGASWISGYAKSISISVWMKNLFVPMYGMYDWQSRIISFFMRLVQVFFRAIGVLLVTIAVSIIVIVYLLLPIATISALVYQIIGLYA
jgi:hypothetical protein